MEVEGFEWMLLKLVSEGMFSKDWKLLDLVTVPAARLFTSIFLGRMLRDFLGGFELP